MIYILILNYNNFYLTKNCIESIFNSNYNKFKLILIDNNSSDNSIEEINKYVKNNNFNIHLILNDSNKGYAHGINIGIKYSLDQEECDFLFILNNDTLIDNNCLRNLAKNYKSNSIVGPAIFDYDQKNVIQSLGGTVHKYLLSTSHLKKYNSSLIDYIPGTALFFHREIIDTIGFLPEEYFMYYEDVDWSTAAKLNGISLIINKSAVVCHKKKMQLSLYLKARSIYNRILYCNKYFKYKLPVIIPLSLASFLKLIFIYLIRENE